jgi:ketosteroid isomerase-like protein
MIDAAAKSIADYIAATNAFDTDAMMATFTDDALVNDIRREFIGKAAIREWSDREITGAKVTLEPVQAKRHYGEEIVTFKLDGEYDKRGLPDPLLLTYYFSLYEDRICRLIILHNKPVS